MKPGRRKKKEQSVEVPSHLYEYNKGDIVLTYHGPHLYKAKILKRTIVNKVINNNNNNNFSSDNVLGFAMYFVHYHGWNQQWDEWVDSNRIVPANDENIKIMDQLKKHTNNEKKTSSNAINNDNVFSIKYMLNVVKKDLESRKRPAKDCDLPNNNSPPSKRIRLNPINNNNNGIDHDLEVMDAPKSLICPLTQATFKEPMKSILCNHIFEKTPIINYIESTNGYQEQECPIPGCSMPIYKQCLILDEETIKLINNKSNNTEINQNILELSDNEDDDINHNNNNNNKCPTSPNEIQFYNFLKGINMETYFDKFAENNCCDMESIKFFDDETLKNEINIKSKILRKKLLAQCDKIKVEMNEFANTISSLLLQRLSKYGIVTLNILCNEIKSENDLKNKFLITNDNQIAFLWSIVEKCENLERID